MNYDRGIVTIDYAFGTGIFLITLIIGFSVLNGTLPEAKTLESDEYTSEIIEDELTKQILVTENNQYNLDPECTEDFFLLVNGNSPNINYDCNFSSSDEDVTQSLSNREFIEINVTIENTDGTIASINGTNLQYGSNVGPNDASITRQIVYINNTRHILIVRIW